MKKFTDLSTGFIPFEIPWGGGGGRGTIPPIEGGGRGGGGGAVGRFGGSGRGKLDRSKVWICGGGAGGETVGTENNFGTSLTLTPGVAGVLSLTPGVAGVQGVRVSQSGVGGEKRRSSM